MDAPDEQQPPAAVHVPVLLERVLELLAPSLQQADAVLVDATLGLGGHSAALLAAHPRLRLIGLDRDPDALRRSAQRLAPYADRIELVHAVYDELPEVLAERNIGQINAALFDLGVSSMQLDLVERGFSYAQDAPLDMRMDATDPVTAEDIVNEYPVPRLARILRDYGEERFALRVAQAIDRRRKQGRITSSAELAELVREAIPAATRRTGGHPAKRTFQALRIEVNAELAAIESAVPAALSALTVGGRIVVLSYHSLEDRIVKRAFAELATDRTPPALPVQLAEAGPQLRLLNRGAEPATETEIAANPRAASVRLRAAERIRSAA
ncbi:MAG TPA: 16S rRNA (cytosine(1402)-N(4))-methyltransferase RsmH [Jatrophihabitans sp.]|nr:16S rRNA (cytosine(1402)-N(4))-methyltransferase RsmH [Jatrophihabitans sp.]